MYMEIFITLLVLAIWIWIGLYGLQASKKKDQRLITLAWAILIVVVAIYIVSGLFV